MTIEEAIKISAIYRIQSKIKPERCYIGSAVSIDQRWILHLSRLRRNVHDNKKLQAHFNKYGESDLQFSILLGCEKEDLLKIEQYFIDSYNPWFNHCKKAGSRLGLKASSETKAKMSKSQKKRNQSKTCSDETKNKMRIIALNRPKISNETKIKMSKSQKVAIVQCDIDNQFIKNWDSGADVKNKLGIDSRNISKVLNNKRKTAGGFKWKYKLIA